LLLAKNLPFLPNGVEPDNPRVKRILERISAESGELVGKDTIRDHRAKLEELMPKVERIVEELEKATYRVQSSLRLLEERKAAMDQAEENYKAAQKVATDLCLHIENFWMSDLTSCRDLFQESVRHLSEVEAEDWFTLRQYMQPPRMVEKVMMAACIILRQTETWENARLLIGDFRANRGMDEIALIEQYELKIVSLMNRYNVYASTKDFTMLSRVEDIIKHPRFTSDNLAIANYGMGLPRVVDWIKALFAYIKRSQGIVSVYEEHLVAKDKAARAEYIFKVASDRFKEAKGHYDRVKTIEANLIAKKDDIQEQVATSENLIAQCEAMVSLYEPPEEEPDFYQKKVEEALKDQRVQFEILIESMIMEVENRADKKAKLVDVFNIGEHIEKEIANFREQLYIWRQNEDLEGQQLKERREGLIWDFFYLIVADINRVMNQMDDSCQRWCMLDGSTVTSDFVMYMIRKAWADLDYAEYERYCCEQW